MTRILYIFRGLVPPGEDKARDRFTYLSELAEGEVFLPAWWSSAEEASPFLKPTFPVYRVGKFSYHIFLEYRFVPFLRATSRLLFFVWRGLQLHREKKLDVIITYGTNTPGIAGVILKWLTGAKLVVEIPGVPENAFRYDVSGSSIILRLKRCVANYLLNISVTAADRIKLLYPWQLEQYPRLRTKRTAVFHNFVPVSSIQPQSQQEKVILAVGHPWYTKGVDVLIRAFTSIGPEFPDWKLKLMGYYPDRALLDELAKGCEQIEFVSPRLTAFDEIACCSIYVLASRTEAMGRVLLEAMAARKPIVASAVGGVPHYIKDGDNGLLFESENVNELAAKLSLLMRNPELRERLAKRGYERVRTEFDETAYVRAFRTMLQSLTEPATVVNSAECESSNAAKSVGGDYSE